MDVLGVVDSPTMASNASLVESYVQNLGPVRTSTTHLGPWASSEASWAMAAVLLLLPYLLSTVKFHRLLRNNKGPNGRLLVPVVPFWIPGLFHAVSLMDPAGLFSRLTARFGRDKPFMVRAGFLRLIVFANPEHVKSVFRNSKQMTNTSFQLLALYRLLGLPSDVVPFLRADDSGTSLTPRKGAVVTDPSRRILFLTSHNIKTHLSGRHLDALNVKYMEILDRNLSLVGHDDDDGWVAHPDLFSFVQMVSTAAAVEALAGRALLDVYPNFVSDMSYFQTRVPDLLGPWPRFFFPQATACRQRLLNGIKRWHLYAHQRSDCRRTGPSDPEWEPFFGTKLVRVRQEYQLALPEMHADVRATEDLGLFFGATATVSPTLFWCVLETLRTPGLKARLMTELDSCRVGVGIGLDVDAVVNQPLLSSVYAEVLRLYMAVVVSRVAEYGPVTVAGGYEIPKNAYFMIYSRLQSLDSAGWIAAGRPLTVPLEKFDPERFLVDADWVAPGRVAARAQPDKTASEKKKNKRFSTDGLTGLWMPYGGGDHICPGRHFAKHQTLLTLAALLTRFDLELLLPAPERVGPDLRHAASGVMPPVGKVPFRMRRRRSPFTTSSSTFCTGTTLAGPCQVEDLGVKPSS